MSDASRTPHIDELLDQACQAINEGDRARAKVIAERVLQVDQGNAEAEDLLAAPADHGEIRRLTIMFVDLVDSTALSTRIDPELYRTIVGSYRDDVLRIVRRYEGHIANTKGDGLLAFFGHPQAHEDDVRRAAQAGLDITRAVAELSARVRRGFGFNIGVRVGIHRGIVYLDTAQDDVYGLAANLAARICSIAEPGTVAVSDAVEPLISSGFELEARLPQSVKGVESPVHHFRVIAERDPRPRPLGPLVGRERERAYLERSWADALENRLGTPGVVFQGDAGIGKSRLAWSAVDLAERSHAVVLALIGSPLHTDVGLRPVRRLLERRCGITRTSDPRQRLEDLARELETLSLDPTGVIPLLAPVLGIPPQTGYRPVEAEGRKLFELICGAVHDYLRACVRGAPALVLVEDMHWFDEDTVQAVRSLLNSDLGGHVLIVMTSRRLVPLGDAARAEVFDLAPLSDTESDRLITALHPSVTSIAKQAVLRRCDGIPLYIEELVTKLKDAPSDAGALSSVPDTLYEALFARLRSGAGAVRVVEAAGIIGTRVERALLSAAVDMPGAELDQVLQQLVDSRVLEPIEQDSWRFRHELLREVAAEISPPSLRREMHSRIADSLLSAAADGNPDWPLIAYHCANAERHVEAATAHGQASANAWQRGALEEARSYLTEALAQVERCARGSDRDQMEIALRLRRALLAQAAEGVASPNATADFQRCLQLCSDDLQDDDLFSTVMSLYPYYTMRADLDRAERLVRSIRASLTGSRRKFLPINEFALGMLAWYRGDFGYARSQLDLAAATLTEEATRELDAMLFMPNDPTAGLLTHRALSRYVDADLPGAEAELAAAERRCAELPFPQGAFSLAYARQIEVMIRIESGQHDRAAGIATELAALGEQHGFDSWALVGTAQHASVAAFRALSGPTVDPAALPAHIATITAYVDAWRALGVISLITFYDALLARLLIAAGDLDAANRRLQTALDLAADTGMRFYDAELIRWRAHATDDPAQQRADLTAAVDLAQSQGASLFELRSALDLFELSPETGRPALVQAAGALPADGAWPELVRARTMLG
ncbi:ATP-binding protein [Mycobacterium palustre]|uniref:Guanylate cyclase n=1 Tax=Mycobacterium palustre TaxID=153971 RepID=A0A1X1Z3U1_9MYCO|nr:adenylate/guanylate cyclase domain-containing protein [Mycobacterium palustre]ORW17946.1 guanylate cyclase [Mycobacterium palustre]